MVGLGVANVGHLRLAAATALRVAGLSLALTAIPVPAALSQPSDYPAASLVPRSQSDHDGSLSGMDPSAPPDEAQGGKTEAGTPVLKRNEDAFPAEQRNLFNDVDMVAGHQGLQPFDYLDDHGGISDAARNAIRGKNSWILWGEGNDVFWNWVQQHGYGLTDFLILLDSRQRGLRFAKSGLINQPGMKAQTDPAKRVLGLYLDQADGDQIVLKQPATDTLPARPEPQPHRDLFEPGDPELYQKTLAQLPRDGVDPSIYGYPSGILGLRLMPNPDFFGKTKAAQTARGYWKDRVENAKTDAYYTDTNVNADPALVRPFRVSMSCGFCHISPHPLNPPADPENPKWSNLSTTIGDQYWRPVSTFTDLKKPESFLYQFLASQQPGTIDTSLVATDHINNANTITAIFDLPARLARAQQNPPEKQNSSNLLIPQIEDPQPGTNPRHTPRVLIDGSDAVGVFGALSRVYLNIGTYSEEWKRLQNLLIGFTPQQPFAVATAIKQSVYWRTADKYRIPYLAAFFTYPSKDGGGSVTRPMHLADTPEGGPMIQAEHDAARSGRTVFVENCAVCHSSKQPPGLSLNFSRNWASQQTTTAGLPPTLTLPMDFADWTQFTKSAAYGDYVKQISALAGTPSDQDPFLKDNFLSTDIRVPVTLVGTNSGRAVATNAMRGQVWDNFSSETYKSLPAVGDVHFFNPFSGLPVDRWGNNDSYDPPAGGPGYYRPASLIGLWATAPFLHNNALGEFTGDPSVKGRLKAFDDGIDKILWSGKRQSSPFRLPGDLRGQMAMADGDSGFIYRTPQVSWIDFPARFIRPLITGVIGVFWVSFLTTYFWVGLVVLMLLLVFIGRERHAGFFFALIAVLAAVVLRGGRIDTVYPWLWLVPAIAAIIAAVLWLVVSRPWVARVIFAGLAVVSIVAAVEVHAFVDGKMGDLKIGPVPAGTPVNLLMNINPQAPIGDLLAAVSGMTRAFLRIHKDHLSDTAAWQAFKNEAARPLLRASKCPDFVLDRGHWFAEALSDQQKVQLKAFLKTI